MTGEALDYGCITQRTCQPWLCPGPLGGRGQDSGDSGTDLSSGTAVSIITHINPTRGGTRGRLCGCRSLQVLVLSALFFCPTLNTWVSVHLRIVSVTVPGSARPRAPRSVSLGCGHRGQPPQERKLKNMPSPVQLHMSFAFSRIAMVLLGGWSCKPVLVGDVRPLITKSSSGTAHRFTRRQRQRVQKQGPVTGRVPVSQPHISDPRMGLDFRV